MKEWLILLITQHIYSFSRIHCVLNFEPIDENVFPLPLDEPHY